uniref:rust resistance kinase Lr10-like n=1 Tax=Erigeron canadensis TaxID=72917 RepID=UPI001CB98219|nr:rust resistance kinase Lr10-like [Erigeron canadensis]
MHLDIKPHNILLDEDFCPKIAYFGLAKLHSRKDSIVSMLEARGTIGYIAPEVFNRNFGVVSHKADVYSYGMLILEMVGGKSNVDAGTDKDDTKSQSGYVFILNGGAVDWKSKKKSTVAMFTTESEYIAALDAAMEAVWIRNFLSGLDVMPSNNTPMDLYCDNPGAIVIANEPGVQKAFGKNPELDNIPKTEQLS